jgi:hypothetical protein
MHVHFVGSVGLDTSEEVFAAVGDAVKPYIKRCPDGEIGGRRSWISWQWPLLRAMAFLEIDEARQTPGVGLSPLKLKKGVEAEEIHFGELGYAREAKMSYQDFLRARETGALPTSVRFQVCLPTPLAVIGAFIVPEHISAVLPAYERAMIREVERVCAAIRHRDLALQWDVCIEMVQWDGRLPHLPEPPNAAQVFGGQFARLCNSIPREVEIGFHLCYGDLDAKHFVEPQDLGKAVELANVIVANVRRPVNWLHMPVPVDRHDDAYFAPLAGLQRGPEMEVYLGLVHGSDGVQGAVRRMRAAAKFIQGFGIATECGIARARTPETVRELLRLHARAAQAFS